MTLKTKKLCRLRWEMILEHKASWIIFIIAIILSVLTAIIISYYHTNSFASCECGYAITLFLNTLSIGYFSAFIFYIFHDFLPHSTQRLEDIQRTIRLILPINDMVETLEDSIFKQVPPEDDSTYVNYFCQKITEYYVKNGQNKLRVIDAAMKYLHYMSSNIEKCRNLLLLMDKGIVPPEIFNTLTLIDIYQIIQNKDAIENISDNEIDMHSLSLIISDFKEHKGYLKKYVDRLDAYSYITKKVFVPYS